jgi:DNA-binding NtrC family response regulator
MHINIIDKSEDLANIMSEYLIGLGHEVTVSKTLEAALDSIKEKEPQVLFIDPFFDQRYSLVLQSTHPIRTQTVLMGEDFRAKHLYPTDFFLPTPFNLVDLDAIIYNVKEKINQFANLM